MSGEELPEIVAFRAENVGALTDAGHPEHSAKVQELYSLYEKGYSGEAVRAREAEENQRQAAVQVDSQPSIDAGVLNDVAKDLQPAGSPDDYQFQHKTLPADGVRTDDGTLPIEIDKQFESDVRGWMQKGGVTPAEANGLWHDYAEELNHGFTSERIATNEATTVRMLEAEYPGGVNEALKAANRLVQEIGGESLMNWLDQTGLGSHPRVVMTFVKKAKGKGYF